jgi:hypothetical protein
MRTDAKGLPAPRHAMRGLALLLALAALLVWLLNPAALQAQVSGEVIDISTREPIPYANVALVDSAGNVWAQVVTDSVGYFSILPMTNDEVFNFQVIAMGYAGVEIDPIRYDGTPVHRTLGVLAQELNTLEGLNVEVEGQDVRLLLFGFYDRKDRGFGHFIDRDQIAATVEPGVTGILRGTPGLLVRGDREVLAWRNNGGTMAPGLTQTVSALDGVPVRNRRAQLCRPVVFVNGGLNWQLMDNLTNDFSNTQSGRTFNDWLPDKDDIIGVEVYRSASSLSRDLEIQIERFRADATRGANYLSTCGVIMIWTRLERESGEEDGGGTRSDSRQSG